MVLKRKRSDSEMSTSSSLFSSPLSGTNFMVLDNPQYTIPTPSLFHSRTRKRHRDNRPSESQVHQHTLSILFGAQQAQPQSQSSVIPSAMPSQTPVSTIPSHSSSQQSSLHSFWALPSKPRSSSSSSNTSSTISTPSITPPSNTFSPATNCEDCNVSLNATDNGDGMDIDMMAMDVDDGNYGCTSCGKQVCHGCAVSNLGADRKCLTCAKPTSVWQGGLGWVPN